MALLGGLLKGNSITYEKVESLRDLTPKRICFNSCHSGALRKIKKNDTIGFFNVPFTESIGKIFKRETGLNFKQNRFGRYFYPIKQEDEMDAIELFIEKYKENVFLRDNLDISIAIAENFKNDEERTHIGHLEKEAKYDQKQESYLELKEIIKSFIENTPYYKKAKCICPVPSSDKDQTSIPVLLCDDLANELDIKSLSKSIYWQEEKKSLKECPLREKWTFLEEANLKVDYNFNRENVILLDDLYQSGTTIQYIAMKLKEKGAKMVFGLTIVKSKKDTDNQ